MTAHPSWLNCCNNDFDSEYFLFVVMPNFAEKVEIAVDALSCNPPREIDENEFIDASRLVYDGVREIRQAVLCNRVCIL
jgi:hypothetical protein